MGLDRLLRNIQNLVGPKTTDLAQEVLGSRGTRLVREFAGRTARHRIQISCNRESIGQGVDAWTISPDFMPSHGVVYSLGVGNVIRSDLDLIKRFRAEVFAFDPTPGAIAWIKQQSVPHQFHFIEYGIMDYDGIAQFQHFGGVQYGPRVSISQRNGTIDVQVRRLATMMKRLSHSKIDLLKINIEGGEYAVIADLIASQLDVGQIVVEFHHRLPGYSIQQTKQAVRALTDCEYKIFHIAENGKEYSFIKPTGKV